MTNPRSRGDSPGMGRGRGRGHGRGRGRGRGFHMDQASSSRQNYPTGSNDLRNSEMNQDLPERFRKGSKRRNTQASDNWNSSDQSDWDFSVNLQIREYVQVQESLSSRDDKELWIDAPEIPKSSEIKIPVGKTVELVANKKDAKFKTTRNYLKTHYGLLREDAVGPLRDALLTFRDNPYMDDNSNLSIYEKVHICGFTFTNLGIAARLKFSTKRAGRKILWSASKRLVSGSLVALTPAEDNFQNHCIVAIVAARPLELLEREPPEVDIYFSSPDNMRIDPQVGYVMIEAKQGYFEAYRHTLRALQKISRESSNILGVDTSIEPPKYLQSNPNQSLLAMSDGEEEPRAELASVDIIHNWPAVAERTILDQSQWDALHHILTKKLAIIQGPPGTGKTFVSKVALQLMVQNHAVGDPPIIIAAQTNHALDQLLMHVKEFEPEFIRLGGRSTISDIKKRALYEVRSNESIPNIRGSLFNPARKKLERQQYLFGEILSIFDENVDLIPCEELCKLGVINAAQEKSLVDAAKNWITADDCSKEPMQYWLHKALIPFEVTYEDDTFGFEDMEEDLEVEQLRETEAEHGITDEEDIEALKGPFKAISDKWTVMTPSDGDLESAKRMLDTKQDLWSVPEYLRGPMYSVMKQRAKDIKLRHFKERAQEYDEIVRELKIGKWEKDAVFLKRAKVIGMTTTGLSKYRPLIASLNPKVILIEEAAEVLEGPVTAAAMESVEHLILVGDHQQLQGHCALKDLENEPFFLNVSMFERLVSLGMPFKTLSRQRRMATEIRELVSSLYPSLKDHESVLARKKIPQWGMGSVRSFFFNHDFSELKDESMSTYNEEEARMVAKFFRHLRRNQVPAPAITILTFYNGQRKRILRELRNDPETNDTYNLVKTVDSYQGEENDIIILSLVRSNIQGDVGFLSVTNRVCVALSRARLGLYLFGNGKLLIGDGEKKPAKSDLWKNVGELMKESQPSRFGTELPLTCRNHNRTLMAQWPEDFDKNEGGCDLWCNFRGECGHVCKRKCHPIPHKETPCREQCDKMLACGHPCAKKCHEVCRCNCDDFQNRFGASNTRFASPSHEDDAPFDRATCIPSNEGIGFVSGRGNSDGPDQQGIVQGAKRQAHSGKPLARGGAAFQPLLTPPKHNARRGVHGSTGGPSQTNARAQTTSQENWTSFANGGVKEDDAAREKQQAPHRYRIAQEVLIDLLPDDTHGTVEHSREEHVEGDRKKYTQTFRPAAPNQFEHGNIQQTSSMKDVEESGTPSTSQVKDLLD